MSQHRYSVTQPKSKKMSFIETMDGKEHARLIDIFAKGPFYFFFFYLSRNPLKDPLASLSEEEKALVWKFKDFCRMTPESLPKLLLATKWVNASHVRSIHVLLSEWRSIPPERALEVILLNDNK